ncbi:MAG: dTMP kinase [Nitrospiraceae bacterium]
MSRKRRPRTGTFITFEGVEGSGKSTQAQRLAKKLREEGYTVVETREPGGTRLAEDIRRIVLNSRDEMVTPACEAFLILAGRCQHVSEIINPALKQGAVVLCDRFSDSTLAYQGHARGLAIGDLRKMNDLAAGGLTPHLTLLFDVPISTGLARRRSDRQEQNRLDRESLRFHGKVRKGFLALAAQEPRRIKVIEAGQSPEAVEHEVAMVVGKYLQRTKT